MLKPIQYKGFDTFQKIHWVLGTAIILHAIALFAMVFTAHQTHFGNYLFLVMEMPNSQAVFIEKITVSVFLLIVLFAVIRPRAYLLIPVVAYVFFEAYSGFYQGGYRFSEWTLATQALRYAIPFVLLFLFLPSSQTLTHVRKLTASGWLLRVALFSVFFSHGMESLKGNPAFIDLVIGSTWNLFGIRMMEASVIQVLQVIGVVDLAVATAVLIRPWPYILYWMAFWGLVTAFSRTVSLGWGSYFEVLLRASHILAPFILLEINKYLSVTKSKSFGDSFEVVNTHQQEEILN